MVKIESCMHRMNIRIYYWNQNLGLILFLGFHNYTDVTQDIDYSYVWLQLTFRINLDKITDDGIASGQPILLQP